MNEEEIIEKAAKLYEDTDYIFSLTIKDLNIMVTGLYDLLEMEKLKQKNKSKDDYISKDKIRDILNNEIINISGFECVAKADIEKLLEV